MVLCLLIFFLVLRVFVHFLVSLLVDLFFCLLLVILIHFLQCNIDIFRLLVFLKGDEIIKFTAEVIVSNVHQEIPEGSFVGHIGGDDFVAIIPTTQCDKICQDIISTFDTNVLKFFTPEDIERGYIEVANRKGIIEQFPLTSVSIGVVVADVNRFYNMLEIGEVGAQVKHAAKSVMGSSYSVDKRKIL